MSHLAEIMNVSRAFVDEYCAKGRVAVNMIGASLVIDDIAESGRIYNSIKITQTWDSIKVEDINGKTLILPTKYDGMDYNYIFGVILCNFEFLNFGRYM